MKHVSKLLVAIFAAAAMSVSAAPKQWLDYKGNKGPGKGKKVVLISGDEEYRSEEAMPVLAGILSRHHGFDCRCRRDRNTSFSDRSPSAMDHVQTILSSA